LFLVCIDSHGHDLDKWLGKKLLTNQTIFRAENIFVQNSTAQLLKKVKFMFWLLSFYFLAENAHNWLASYLKPIECEYSKI
jgi:hypothetical protein